MDEIVVTVICLTFNHEATIRDALEGFVRQQTRFRFEALIHDDASTDGTAGIVRSYQARFPDLIRPVFQTVNQYTQGVAIAKTFLYPLIRGKYVALCEGDDCWTDPLKLQKQVDALEAHPDVDICTHRAAKVRSGRRQGYVAPRLRDSLIPAEEVILGGGAFVATSSILCRTEAYKLWTPMREIRVSDYVLQIQGSLRGGMLYLGDCMSIYRQGLSGSWTARHRGQRRMAHRAVNRRMLRALDRYTEGRFRRAIELRIRLYDSDDLLTARRYAALFTPKQLRITCFRIKRKLCKIGRKIYRV